MHRIDLKPYVQPASLDLPIYGKVFLLKERVLPFKKKMIDLLPELQLESSSLDHDALLLKGQTYLCHVGRIRLPKGCRGHLSPKSSIGRVDLMVRGVVDGCGLYDTLPSGQVSNLWLEITPQSFNVRIREGLALTQLMLFQERSESTTRRPIRPKKEEDTKNVAGHDDEDEEEDPLRRVLYDAKGEPLPVQLHRGAVVLSLRVPEDVKEIAGYEAKPTSEVLNLSEPGTHDHETFFKPIKRGAGGRLTLEKDRFYILATKEHISVPLTLSGEMVPFSHLVGELRAHYAGFFDPGFGYGKAGEKRGTVAVLEVRPHETITIYDGQPICLMEFFQNSRTPAKPYGYSGNNYAEQKGPKLAKYFK